jgi:hypothetical protein
VAAFLFRTPCKTPHGALFATPELTTGRSGEVPAETQAYSGLSPASSKEITRKSVHAVTHIMRIAVRSVCHTSRRAVVAPQRCYSRAPRSKITWAIHANR